MAPHLSLTSPIPSPKSLPNTPMQKEGGVHTQLEGLFFPLQKRSYRET